MLLLAQCDCRNSSLHYNCSVQKLRNIDFQSQLKWIGTGHPAVWNTLFCGTNGTSGFPGMCVPDWATLPINELYWDHRISLPLNRHQRTHITQTTATAEWTLSSLKRLNFNSRLFNSRDINNVSLPCWFFKAQKELASWCIFPLQNSSKASEVSSAVFKLTMYSWNVWVVNILEAFILQILSEVMKMSQMYCGKVPDRQMLKSTQNVFTKFYFLRKWISKAWLILHISQNQMAYKNVFISAKC